MAASKQRYSVTRMQKLPPISEETSFGVRSPRIAPAPRYEIRKQPISVKPAEPHKPRIHVRPLPGSFKSNISYDNGQEIVSATQNQQIYHRPPEVNKVNESVVDSIVADYLHYASYGHLIPVYEGTGIKSCPCCTKRNQENVRTMLGLPVNREKEDEKKQETKKPTGNAFNPWTYPIENSGKPQPIPALEKSWMAKQPHPTYKHYLNPEFNRPVYVYEKPPENKERGLVVENVLNATAQYDESMRRLQKFGK